jgi:CO/xanthine dehydrogenase Mo-binding subunit
MEPMNCTVHLQKDRCDVWVGTQALMLTQSLVVELTGLPNDAIKIHNHLIDGGFGRRLEADGTVLAVKIAKHVDGRVKVIWSREEDLQHDMYRPYYFDRLSAGLDAEIPDFTAAQWTAAVSTDRHPEGGWISAAARHWDMASKKPRMSASSTQFTRFLSPTRCSVFSLFLMSGLPSARGGQ